MTFTREQVMKNLQRLIDNRKLALRALNAEITALEEARDEFAVEEEDE